MKPADLFGHVELVGEDGDFLGEALIVERHAVGELTNGRAQSIALLDQPSRRALVDSRNGLLDDRQSFLEVARESRALSGSHLVERGVGALHYRDELGGAPLGFVIA